jgi:hypothetical protein
MATKPTKVSSVLSPTSREPGKKPPDHNRFAVLMDRSRSPSVSGSLMPPTPARKRPSESDCAEQPAGKSQRMDSNNKVFFVMESLEKMLVKGRDDLGKAKALLSSSKDAGGTNGEVLGGMINAMEYFADAIEALSSVVVDAAKGKVVVGDPKKSQPTATPVAKPTAAEVKKKKFANVVKDAEKSLLVHKLDLGKVPIMNTETLSKHVTQSIVAKAAAADGNANGRPKEETILTLEDTLSMVSSMDFFGKVTKPYANKFNDADPANGTFHTLPVKLNFKSKEAKQRAEQVLRKTCKVQCGTPFPKRLRVMLGETVKQQKNAYPNCFIQTRVDLDSMSVMVSRKTNDGWVNNYCSIPIPEPVLDTDTVTNSKTGTGNAL